MTSGLFNTGVAGDSAEITSSTPAVQPGPSMSKFGDHDDFLAETFDPNFDMNMFGELGTDFDPLGDTSMDSFTDLTAFLSENIFLDQLQDEEPAPLMDFTEEVKPSTKSVKRSFDEMEAGSSDLDKLMANVAVPTTSDHDHDYSSKCPRMSTVTEEPQAKIFLAPAPISDPTPSTSHITSDALGDKSQNRREKNNVASKRSREIRKQKFADLETEAERLIVDNARLEKRVVELERLAKQMREILVAKMAGK